MKINIVIREGDLGWILGRLAKELSERLGWTINQPGADIDYCIPYYQYKNAKARIKVPLFTHLEKEGKKRALFFDVHNRVNHRIYLSAKTIEADTAIPSNSHIIHLGSDLEKFKVFGIVGKDYNTGRKNFHWVPRLSEEFSVLYKSLSASYEERYDFYSKVDYLIVTSSIEGGPVPVLDAIAMGVPVIAPDTGWCWEHPVIKYEKDNFKDLLRVLRKLNNPRTWEHVAIDHKRVFEGFKL